MISADFTIEDALDASAMAFDAQLEESARSVGYMRDGYPSWAMWTSGTGYRHGHLMPIHNIYTYDAEVHYTQTSGASFHASPAESPWRPITRGFNDAAHAPLAAPPNAFPTMNGPLSDDEIFARPIECDWNHMEEDFRHLRWLYAPPLDDAVAFALDPPTTNPNIWATKAQPSLPLASVAPTLDANGITGQVVEQVVRRNRTRLTAYDAIFIYQQKSHKKARMAAKLGEEYNVTAKTVRDIWRQRTWRDATRELSSNGNTAIANGDTAIESLAPPPASSRSR